MKLSSGDAVPLGWSRLITSTGWIIMYATWHSVYWCSWDRVEKLRCGRHQRGEQQ